jgi:hypothetical protein
MRAGHGEDMRRAVDQSAGKRLAPQIANIDALLFADINGMQTWRLTADRVHAGGYDLNVFAIADEPPEEAFSHWAAANIAGADKEDVFHSDGRRRTGIAS